jgi:hypothetical protein
MYKANEARKDAMKARNLVKLDKFKEIEAFMERGHFFTIYSYAKEGHFEVELNIPMKFGKYYIEEYFHSLGYNVKSKGTNPYDSSFCTYIISWENVYIPEEEFYI